MSGSASSSEADAYAFYTTPKGGNGGDGANGAPGETYGSAGSGGGGGGGGGAAGTCTMNAQAKITLQQHDDDRYAPVGASCRASTDITNGRGGTGGAGGAGGAGADGCIILYYGVQKETVSGPMKTSNGKIFLDKLGRLMVV